jgi:cytochrome P450
MTQPDLAPSDLPTFPFDHPTGLDAFALFKDLRERQPVSQVRLPGGGRAYVVARYEEARRVLTEPVFSRVAAQRDDVAVLIPASKIPGTILNADPPDHTRLRKLIARAFTTGAVARMRPRIEQIAGQLVDSMLEHGPPVDFIAAFAAPLPALVIGDMLGIAPEDRHQLLEWVEILLSTGAHTPEEIQAARAEFGSYLADLIAAKRAAPGTDLTSGLTAARDEGDRLSETELLSTLFILIAGGHETTKGVLTNSILILNRYPDQLALLRDKPELIPGAVEELLRYVPMAWSASERITVEEVRLGGVRIPAYSTVIALIYSANRDEFLLGEPDRLDLTRSLAVPHLAFGHGIHRCLGAPLARLELQTAFVTLLRRLPTLRLAVAESALTFRRGSVTIGPVELPITW